MAVWTSKLLGDIANVSVVPTGTVFAAGKKAKISTPPRPLLPTWMLLPETVGFCSSFAVRSAVLTCFLTAFLSAFAEGALAVAATTWTLAFMPAWMLQ